MADSVKVGCLIHIRRNYVYPSRGQIGNIDDSLMLSSITSMVHQFYIEHRKRWWIFDVTSRFHPCFHCFSTLKPAMFRQKNINESSMKHRRIINGTMMNHRWRNSYFYLFYAEFKAMKLQIFHIKSTFPIPLSKNICQKFNLRSKRKIKGILSENVLAGVLKTRFYVSIGSFWDQTVTELGRGSPVSVGNYIMISQDDTKLVETWFLSVSLYFAKVPSVLMRTTFLVPSNFHILGHTFFFGMFMPNFGNQTSMMHELLMKYRCFEILCFVIIEDLLCSRQNHQCFLKESATNHQRIINETSMFQRKAH